MVKIDKLTREAKQEIISKVANYLLEIAEDDDERYLDDFTVDTTLELLVKYYLEPLSGEDYFGTEGWEHFFDI